MNYRESVDYLLSFADFERSGRFQDRPDVEPALSLLRRLGDPHLGRGTVHIAGSKGKGSVAAMVESVLRAAVEGAETKGRSLVTFDLLTALAFLAFRESGAGWQVLETGLGGRVDSTNVFGGTHPGRPEARGPGPERGRGVRMLPMSAR